MAINWQELIQSLGGQAVFLGFAGWLIKALVSERMARESDKFRTQLRSDADAEIERLKNSLGMAALEHEVRFSKLHERQARVIARVYKLLLKTFWSASEYANQGPRDESKEQDCREQVFALYSVIHLNKLYFPTAVSTLLTEFVGRLRLVVVRLPALHSSLQPSTSELAKQQDHILTTSWKALEEELPGLLKLIETEFQKMLGVASTEQK